MLAAVLFPEAIQSLDESILHAAQSTPQPIVMLLWGMSWIGGGWGLLVLVPFLFRRTSRMAVLWLLASEGIVSFLGGQIKGLIQRPRPCDALGWCQPVIGFSPGGFSFPSGHAAGSFLFCTFVSVLRPRYAPLLMAFAIGVACSRVVLGVHYPSDVTGGALFGTLSGFAAAKLYRHFHPTAKASIDPPPPDAPASPADENAEPPQPRSSSS